MRESIGTDDATVAVRTGIRGVSLALGRAKVRDEGERVAWDMDTETGAGTVRDTGEGGGEEGRGVGASGVDSSG